MNAFLRLCLFPALTTLWAMAAPAAEPASARPPHIVFMLGEAEYDTARTVPAFAKAELEPRGIRCTFAILRENTEDFPGLEALKDADLLFVSVRRHSPAKAQMDLIRAHVAAGKPVVGIRTASHAFSALKGRPDGPWETFDAEVLGGHYSGHYGVGVPTFVKVLPEAAAHPVLTGVAAQEFAVTSHLYKNQGIAARVTPLMSGRVEGRAEVEPVAWVGTQPNRVFYTSLGAPGDFELPQFRRLLLNGMYWALGLPVP